MEAFLQTAVATTAIDRMKTGGSDSGLNLTQGRFRKLLVPVAPPDQQKRIVAEIEKQFSRLDEAVANLHRAKANLKRYKAAILKAAVEGKLTEDWRAANPNVEPASELLKRILAERRAKWEDAELAKMKRKGKVPKDSRWKKRYKEPTSTNPDVLRRLPQSWTWITLDQLSDPSRAITYGVIKLGSHKEDGVPTLRSSNVRHLRFELDGLKKIAQQLADSYSRTTLRGGEVLVTVRGTLGGVAETTPEFKGWNISREVAAIVPLHGVCPRWLSINIGSKPTQAWLSARARGIAYTGINIATLKETPIALMPADEQKAIVELVDSQLSFIQEFESVVDKELRRARLLRQTILTEAFSGALIERQATRPSRRREYA